MAACSCLTFCFILFVGVYVCISLLVLSVQLLFVAVCMLVIMVSVLSSIVCVGLLSSNDNSRLLSWFLYSSMFSVLMSSVGG